MASAEQIHRGLLAFADSMDNFPRSGNPLVEWRLNYARRTIQAPRPTVGQSGAFRGNTWDALAPQYTRKTDGVTVPVWGGVPRAVFNVGQGPGSRLGVVTRAGFASTRKGGTLSKAQKRGGFGVVKKGQVFSQRNVLGKLKSDGSRYQQGDLQWGRIKPDSPLGDWITAEPVLSPSGTSLRIASRHPASPSMDDRRPMIWGPQIADEENADLLRIIDEYTLRRLGDI